MDFISIFFMLMFCTGAALLIRSFLKMGDLLRDVKLENALLKAKIRYLNSKLEVSKKDL